VTTHEQFGGDVGHQLDEPLPDAWGSDGLILPVGSLVFAAEFLNSCHLVDG